MEVEKLDKKQAAAATQMQSQPVKKSMYEEENFVAMSQNTKVAEILQGCKHMFSSAPPANLNDPQTAEYHVQTVKHYFDRYIVVQYSITNTLEEHILSGLKLKVGQIESGYGLQMEKIVHLEPSEQIKYNEKKYVYLILTKQNCEHPFPQAKISQKLAFTITEIDVDSKDELGSYEEDYDLKELQLAVRDYLTPEVIPAGNFKTVWETIGTDPKLSEASQTFQLASFKSMDAAVAGVIAILGSMYVCDGTDRVNVTEKVHNLLLAGSFMGMELVLVRG